MESKIRKEGLEKITLNLRNATEETEDVNKDCFICLKDGKLLDE